VTGAEDPHVYWKPHRRGSIALWWFARVLLRATLPWMFGFHVAGRDRLPRRGGVLVVCNHIADVDPLFVGVACVPRRARYMALSHHFTTRPFAELLFALGGFPVRLDRPDVRALRYARERLEAGEMLVVFPEGTPAWGPEMGEFRDGMGLLGLTPGVTVIPAALWGSHRIVHGWKPVGRGPVWVAFGEPLEVPAEGSRRERSAELTRRARAAIDELRAPMLRARP
jgi:1-acyl-sn-glycerol-3-phosphate acyltransferase